MASVRQAHAQNNLLFARFVPLEGIWTILTMQSFTVVACCILTAPHFTCPRGIDGWVNSTCSRNETWTFFSHKRHWVYQFERLDIVEGSAKQRAMQYIQSIHAKLWNLSGSVCPYLLASQFVVTVFGTETMLYLVVYCTVEFKIVIHTFLLHIGKLWITFTYKRSQ